MTTARILNFGTWSSRDGHHFELTWNAANGWLSLGGERIAHIASEERLQNILVGWGDHLGQPNSVIWLTSRLDGAR